MIIVGLTTEYFVLIVKFVTSNGIFNTVHSLQMYVKKILNNKPTPDSQIRKIMYLIYERSFMIFQNFILVGLPILMTSCEFKDGVRFRSFPIEAEIISEALPIHEHYHNSYIDIIDTLLLIICPYAEEYYIQVYQRNNFHHVKSFCHKGKGPYEISMIGPYSIDKSNKNLWIVDATKNSVWKYSLDSLLNNTSYYPITTKIPQKFYPIGSISNFNSELLIVPDPLGIELVGLINTNGELSGIIGSNLFQGVRSNTYFSQLSRIHVSVYTNKNKLVIGYRHFDILSIYNLANKEVIINVSGPDRIKLKNQLRLPDSEQVTAHDGEPYLCDNYIFAPFHGKVNFTLSENKIIPVFPNEIHVFNWNGHPVMKLTLDHQFCSFAVDQERMELIVFAVDSEESILFYDLANVLEF